MCTSHDYVWKQKHPLPYAQGQRLCGRGSRCAECVHVIVISTKSQLINEELSRAYDDKSITLQHASARTLQLLVDYVYCIDLSDHCEK